MRLLNLAIALALAAAPAIAAEPSSGPPTNMREYFLVLLVNPGPERIPMPEDVFKAHMAYMNKNGAAGTYVMGGPITDGSRIRGIIIVQAKDVATARAIVEQDPAVKAHILAAEVHSAMFEDLSILSKR